jgi:hypothetical protein
MANPWFRLYSEFASDPKVQLMPEHMQRRLVMIFCLRCCDVLGTLPDEEMAFAMHISIEELAETKALFLKKNFIDEDWRLPHWNERQFISDSSTDRTRRYRERKRTSQERPVTECVTAPDTEQIQKQTQIQKHKPAPNGAVAARPEEFGNIWNRERGILSKITEFTESRRRRVKTRIGQGITLEKFRDAVRKCRDTPFLRGESKEGWQADFDWLIRNDSNIFKVLEGKYDGNTNGFHSESKTERLEREVQELLDRETVDSA